MAQPVHCDMTGQESHLADVLVSQIANGDTTAWCFTHYVDVCQAVLDTATAAMAEAAQADQEATARLEGEQPGPGETDSGDGQPAAPTEPDAATGPDDGPPGTSGDESTETGLGGPEAVAAEEPTATTVTA